MKKQLLKLLCAYTFLAAVCSSAEARPISYPGGWTIMQMNNAQENSLHIHYSPSFKYSIGLKEEYMRGDDDYMLHTVQLNTLAYRRNTADSQANVYLKFAGGVAEKDSDITPAMWMGIAGDWETRRVFTSYEARVLNAVDVEQSAHQSARVGVAPYVAEFGSLHTWLMLQVDHHPSVEGEEIEVTPLVRMFKGPALVEVGYSFERNLMFNFMYRF